MNEIDLSLPATTQIQAAPTKTKARTRAPSSLAIAFATLGVKGLARTCRVTVQAVHRWKRRDRLPRTELTGETHYAELISAEMIRRGRGILKITEQELLKEARKEWREARVLTRARAKERLQARTKQKPKPRLPARTSTQRP